MPSIKSEDDGDKTYGELWPHRVSKMQEFLRKALDLAATDTPDPETIERIGGGWTGHEALAMAVYSAVKHAASFEDAGDSDSTDRIISEYIRKTSVSPPWAVSFCNQCQSSLCFISPVMKQRYGVHSVRLNSCKPCSKLASR